MEQLGQKFQITIFRVIYHLPFYSSTLNKIQAFVKTVHVKHLLPYTSLKSSYPDKSWQKDYIFPHPTIQFPLQLTHKS